jgi:hypothetical protein
MGSPKTIGTIFHQIQWAHPNKLAIIFGSFNGPIQDYEHYFSPDSMGPFNIINNVFRQLGWAHLS